MGQTLALARRMELNAVRPHPELASSGFCLAAPGSEYLAYLPGGGSVSLDLGAAPRSMTVEWFNTETGASTQADPVSGGGLRELVSPYATAPAVVHLVAQRR
jgi:hypothetical protein